MDFISDLEVILSSNDNKNNIEKDINLELNNEILTRAIDAILPDPNLNSNPYFQINHLVLFDVEFYTLINPEISQFGFIANDDANKIAHLVRELTLLILERVYKESNHFWIVRKMLFLNTNNEYLYKTLYFIRQNYAKILGNTKYNLQKEQLTIRGPYLRMLSRYFMSVDSDEYDKNLELKLQNNQIKNKEQFIQRLCDNINNDITGENYLGYSDHRYYYGDQNLIKYHEAIMSGYINNSHVKKRELSAFETLRIFKLFKLYEKKITVVYKGDSDIKAINNTYRLFDWIDKYNYDVNGKFQSSVLSYNFDKRLEINFQNIYDIAYFNGMSHILYKSAKLSVTCNNMISSIFYKRIVEESTDIGMGSFKMLVSLLKGRKPHDPSYDVLCTLIVVIIINLSSLLTFS